MPMPIISVQGTNLRCSLLFLHPPLVQLPPQMRIKNAASFRKFMQSISPAKLTNSRLSSVGIESKELRSLPSENQINATKAVEGIVDGVTKALKALQKPVTVLILLGLVLNFDSHSALAASGGRMGGRSFSSRSSFSSSLSRGYSTRTTNPNIPYSVPFYAPSPFGFGGGMGTAGSFVAVLGFTFVLGLVLDRSGRGSVLTDTEKTSVLKLQVGLLGMGRSLQRDLNQIAENADTSTKQGLSYVLTESTIALLRHPEYCISGYSSVDVKKVAEEGEKCFNKLSIEERGKFDEETLVNVNNIMKKRPSSQPSTGFSNEYIVITILVAAEGVHKLPSVNNSGDLDKALQMLGSIPSSRLLAVEVLWTPQNESETLSERELLEDYPILRPL